MTQTAYLAGLFDGEGSFSIQVGLREYKGRPSGFFAPSMSVNLHYGASVLDEFVEAFGGTIYPYQRDGRPCGRRWHLGRRELLTVATTTLLPYLRIKHDIAERFLFALSLFPSPLGANRRAGRRVWTADVAVAVAEIALTLNPPRSRKTNKTAEYVEVLRSQLEAVTQ